MKFDNASIPSRHGKNNKPAERAATPQLSDSDIGQPKVSTAFLQWTEEVMAGMKLMHDDPELADRIAAKALTKHQLNK